MAKKVVIDGICEELRGRLRRGELGPESRVVEQEVAESLGVSRTPVREALSRLAGEGLLVSVPNLGTFVKKFSILEVREMFEIREVLEGLAYRRACERFTVEDRAGLMALAERTDSERRTGNWEEAFRTDEDFHGFIISRCCSELLEKELGKYNFQATLVQVHLSPVSWLLRRREISVPHVELARVSNDPELAESLMREHISGLARWLFQQR